MDKIKPLSTRVIIISTTILLIAGGLLFYFTKNYISAKPNSSKITINPAFTAYISAYTAGTISSKSSIKIKFVQPISDSVNANNAVENKYFEFKPNIEGKVYWLDRYTVEFRPDQKMEFGQLYNCKFDLANTFTIKEELLEEFNFNFRITPQFFEIDGEGLKVVNKTSLDTYSFFGSIFTADVSENELVEKMLETTYHGEKLNIIWLHKDSKNHFFEIKGIRRNTAETKFNLDFNGAAIGSSLKLTQQIIVPAIGSFKILDAKVVQQPEQYVLLQFSDIISTKQLEGLIRLGNFTDLQYIKDANYIKIYPPIRQTGTVNLWVSKGVENLQGKILNADYTQNLVFEQLKPAIKSINKGVILPSSQGMVYSFEAVGLKSVQVKIIKIYENNISQFLQINQIDGDYEMERVGKSIINKKIILKNAGVTDLNKWNRFTLDLAELIQTETGAIYQISISFTKKDIVYSCGNEAEIEEFTALEDTDIIEGENYSNENSYWDNYENENNGYDWQQRENPCNPAYYSSNSSEIKQNILASDIGIIAKRGENGAMFLAVTDLQTAKPLSNVTLEILNYQQQILGSVTTNNEGIANIAISAKPFLLVAKSGKQRGYLKLDDQSSLSLSNFDVYGVEIKKGVKGFIYGERGVWRPGDSLFLSFILEDKLKSLPANHPVIFELINPAGQVKVRQVQLSKQQGMYSFVLTTEPNAPTGDWNARVKVGGATFTKKLKIEAIKPNRLKINLDFGKEKLTADDEDLNGKLNVKWLTGAIAKNLKAKFEMILFKNETKFVKFPEYTFDDPSLNSSPQSQTIFEGKLDANGQALIQTKIKLQGEVPATFKAIFKGKVFEQGGDFSIDQFSIPYYPYPVLIGIKSPKGDKRGMLLTDTQHDFDVIAVDNDGNAAKTGSLKVDIYKLDWKWWWEQQQEGANYVNTSYLQPIEQYTVDPIDGKGKIKFRINYPEWGRYFVRVSDEKSGFTTGKIVYADWPGWAGRQKDMPNGAAMLSFSADKEKYSTSEKVKLNFASSEGSTALVSIENGTQVLETYWVNTKKGTTNFEFEAKKSMSPNCFVHITLIQPHIRKQNDLPIRLYGVIPILVEDPDTHLSPIIKMPDELRPEQNVTISVSEEHSKSMSYSIAMVDEGLLDLTKYKTPNPWEQFYAKEALGVKTWDMYDYVIGAYGGELQSLLSIGGDDVIKAKDDNKTIRFKPVVKYFGPYFLEGGKSQSHTFKMPNYVGSVRTMVVAAHQGAYGHTEKTTAVKQPLMIVASLPRVLGPDEELSLPVTIFAMDNSVKNVSVDVKSNTLLKIVGNSKKSISFNEKGDQVIYFPIKVLSKIGKATVSVTAKSGNISSTFDLELEVRNPNPPVTTVVEAVINPSANYTTDYAAVGIEGTNKAILEVSAMPPINLGERLKYLISYPHGCVEQTTSSAFPQLYLGDLMELNNETKLKTEINIKAAINKLQSFQLPNGSFAYWPGKAETDEWATCYVGHFLLEAQDKGYNVPDEMLSKWVNYQKTIANSYAFDDKNSFVQAFRLYTLALSKHAELGAMNRLRETDNLSTNTLWRLAAAYALASHKDIAQNIIQNLPTNTESNKEEYDQTYGSPTRDEAMILETLNLLGDKTKISPLILSISAALSNPNAWMSTQTTAYSLKAIAKSIGYTKNEKGLNFSYSVNQGKAIKATSNLYYAQINVPISGKIKINNFAKGILYTKLLLEGVPKINNQISQDNNLKLLVVYKTMAGEPINPTLMKQGTDFMVDVTVINPGIKGKYKNLALSQIFASGWEIINTRLDDTKDFYNKSKPDYQDYRDDRVYTYFDLEPNQSKTFRILLNSAYLGKFYLPSVYCEEMYDHSINAKKAGMWVNVANDLIP